MIKQTFLFFLFILSISVFSQNSIHEPTSGLTPWWGGTTFLMILAILMIVLVCLASLVFFHELKKRKKMQIELQKRMDDIELHSLRLQMNPHFVFNTLNSIQHFIMSNNTDDAAKYLSRFSKLMRSVMENSKQSYIRIKDEVETLRLYLELESMRFSNKFEFGILVDPIIDVNDDKVPSMLIQPYIENALIHGLLPKSEKGKLFIHLTKSGNSIVCTIEDNGIGRLKSQELNKNRISPHKSIGMSVTKKRLTLLNQHATTEDKLIEEIIDVTGADGNPAGTRVVIRIPVESV